MAPRKYAKKSTKKTYKRTGLKRSIGKVTTNVIQRSTLSVGFPLNFKCKLRYVSRASINVQTGHSEDWMLNNLYAPSVTGGHQPLYYNCMSLIYNEYLVTGCQVTITLMQENSIDKPSCVLFSVRDTDATLPILMSHALEEGNRTVCNLGYAGGGAAVKSISQYVNIAHKHGVKYLTPANTDFTALVNASPRNRVYANLQFFSADMQSNVNLSYTVTLDFYCQFFNKKEIDQS